MHSGRSFFVDACRWYFSAVCACVMINVWESGALALSPQDGMVKPKLATVRHITTVIQVFITTIARTLSYPNAHNYTGSPTRLHLTRRWRASTRVPF